MEEWRKIRKKVGVGGKKREIGEGGVRGRRVKVLCVNPEVD